MTKKCYCINPFCKCLFGCGCTLADKSVGKCMCCIMEETNKKINKLCHKTMSLSGSKYKLDLCKQKFYDIIVVDKNNEFVSCRYECSVKIGSFDINNVICMEKNKYITDDYISKLGKEKNVTITYTTDTKTYDEPKSIDDKYLLLFVDKTTLEYDVFYTESIFQSPT